MRSNIERAAAVLREARFSRKQIAPVASTFSLGSIDEAYAAAAENTRVRIDEGRRVTGRKIGLTAGLRAKWLGAGRGRVRAKSFFPARSGRPLQSNRATPLKQISAALAGSRVDLPERLETDGGGNHVA
jgi:hypothetical protein